MKTSQRKQSAKCNTLNYQPGIQITTHHHRNMYLRARLDTCTNVNLMPASIYQLVFKDPKMQKLTPSTLQVGTYTTDSVKIVGSCKFHLVHPDTKKLLETTFYVAMNNGSVLLYARQLYSLALSNPGPDWTISCQEPV